MISIKNISQIILSFLVSILVIILFDNLWVNIFVIILLLAFVTLVFYDMENALSKDKKTTLSNLENRLKETRDKRAQTYKRFISLSNILSSGFLLIDDSGVIQLANKESQKLLGLDLVYENYEDLKEDRTLYKFLNKVYLTEKRQRQQIKYNNKYLDFIANPLFEHDLYSGSIILINDITLIKNAEKYQKNFTADVSHELRTPLSAIIGFSEILSREKLAKKDRLEFAGLINKEAKRMEQLLTDLNTISKMDRINYKLKTKLVDIKPLIDEATGLVQNKITEKKLILKVNVNSQKLLLDKDKIFQVIINLINNAISYTDNGFIKITGKTLNEEYVLSFEDTGIGIDENELDLIFKRFYRIDKARSRDSGGSGLGLSITKNVIKRHGGTISVKSQENEGTTFTIKLPIKK